MAAKPLPDAGALHNVFDFDPTTGLLTHKVRDAAYFSASGRGGREGQAARWNGRHAGNLAGSTTAIGYQAVRVPMIGGGSVAVMSHQVVWAMFYGKWPEQIIDHINGVRDDNRPANLRLTTLKDNARNVCLPANNTSGVCGVSRHKNTGKWFAQIIVDGKRRYLGSFEHKHEAVAARRAASAEFGFSDGHGKPKLVSYPHRNKRAQSAKGEI